MRKQHADILTEEDLKINENRILVLPFSHDVFVGYNYYH